MLSLCFLCVFFVFFVISLCVLCVFLCLFSCVLCCSLCFFLSFFAITRTPGLGFGRDYVEMHPRSLPQLSKQLRDQNHSLQQQKQIFDISRKK